MANHPSAEKRHRQSRRRRERNQRWRGACRSAVRKARRAADAGEAEARELGAQAERLLRKAASKGIFHARTVSRTVSRLQRAIRGRVSSAS
jgi:small subunit ribosomal protein S20